MKKFSIALFCLFFFAQAKAEVASSFIKVVPGKITGFSSNQNANLQKAFTIIEAVLNSEEFKHEVLNYRVGPTGHGYTSNNKMNNEQVYEFLMNGNEVLGGSNTLGEMNFDIKRYKSSWFYRMVIGYTKIGKSNTIYANQRKYKNFDAIDMAGNVAHEWFHLMGFYHDGADDQHSVPYAVGDIVGRLASKYEKQGYLD